MFFYVYENWTARGKRVRVHRSDCSYCNDGRGVADSNADPAHGRWHPPAPPGFSTLAEARAVAQGFPSTDGVIWCGICHPELA